MAAGRIAQQPTGRALKCSISVHGAAAASVRDRLGRAAARTTHVRRPAQAAAAQAGARLTPAAAAGAGAGSVVVPPDSTFSSAAAGPLLLPGGPPAPVPFPRRQLSSALAVLLMRSCYDAADDLDFIPMDEFQRVFWKLRQGEWQPYTLQYSPLRVQQGELSDPLYFDFISFAQFATLAQEMPRGRQVFREYDEESDSYLLVTRRPELQDNALLPAAYLQRAGERIYEGMREGFRGETFDVPPPLAPGAPFSEVVAGAQRLLAAMVAGGYCLNANLTAAQPEASPATPDGSSSTGGGGSFSVRVEGSATLWALQALSARRSPLLSVHDALAVAAFLRASGRSSTCSLAWSDTAVTQSWRVY